MDVIITKGEKLDRIMMVRADGSRLETRFPKKGPFPHDAVHYAVEKHLRLTDGFWGLVASGHHPEEVSTFAKWAGHASASRATVPEPHIVQLLQAERIVECFEADMWGGETSDETLLETIAVACDYSHVPVPPMDGSMIKAIRAEIAQLDAQWSAGRIAFRWNA